MTVVDSAPDTGTQADPAVAPGVLGWLKGHIPTRASIERNRWLKPVAHRILVPSLWRFNRRSVPRGVALGIVTGILFPFAHMPLAAVLALPFRANVPVAVSTTLINNPLTILPLLGGALKVGRWILHIDRKVPGAPIATNVHAHGNWLHLLAQGSAETAVGLVVLATVFAIGGFLLTSLVWRLRIARQWRRRHARKP